MCSKTGQIYFLTTLFKVNKPNADGCVLVGKFRLAFEQYDFIHLGSDSNQLAN
jgi:hypothetical protein